MILPKFKKNIGIIAPNARDFSAIALCIYWFEAVDYMVSFLSILHVASDHQPD
jgi:hypothetical protein